MPRQPSIGLCSCGSFSPPFMFRNSSVGASRVRTQTVFPGNASSTILMPSWSSLTNSSSLLFVMNQPGVLLSPRIRCSIRRSPTPSAPVAAARAAASGMETFTLTLVAVMIGAWPITACWEAAAWCTGQLVQ